MRASALVIAGNDYLKNYALQSRAPRVALLPSVVDTHHYQPSNSLISAPLRLVWIGSPSTVNYLRIVSKPLADLAAHIEFEFHIVGAPIDLPGVKTQIHAWSEGTEVALISSCHIGIMPLPDLPFERGKCGFKLIQYMACGLPVVASPVGVNTKIVSHGKNGFLALSSKEWYRYLLLLFQSADLRLKLGKNSRSVAENSFSIKSNLPQLEQLLLSLG